MITGYDISFSLEVYAAREKVGVYMPKERYYQEESERKVCDFPASVLVPVR